MKLEINPNNRKYYSDDFIKGFECGVKRQYEEDKKNPPKGKSEGQIYKEYEAKVITRGNCMICGKKLTEGLFLCKECGDKANKESEE